jgi:D-xylulose reductase
MTSLTCSGCGPIGLITAAVAHAYSASKIIAFDISPDRVAFAKKYMSPLTGRPIIDHVFLNKAVPTTPLDDNAGELAEKIGESGSGAGVGDGEIDDHEVVSEGDRKWEQAKKMAAEYLIEAGLDGDEGVDRVIEATGTEDCAMLGVAVAKQGAISELAR